MAPRPLEPQDSQELVAPVKEAAREVLGFGWELFNDRPEFIASTDDRNLLATAVRALSQYNCRRWAAADKSNFSTRVNTGNAQLCGPYLESLGENPDDGDLSVPFTGGQCVGVSYVVRRQNRTTAGNFGAPANTTGIGPVIGPYLDIDGLIGRAGINFAGSGKVQTLSGPATEVLAPTIISITRSDGLPDTCGNPPTQISPPSTVTPVTPIPPTITINLPGVGPVTVDLSFDEDGDPVFCIEEIDTCITVDVGDPGGAEPPPGLEPGDQGEPGGSIDVGSGDVAEGEDPDRNLTGVLVQTIAYPPRTNRLFNAVEAYTKGGYWVYFGGDAGFSQNPEAAISRADQFYYAPPNSNRFRVVPNNGFTLRVTPYYERE